MRVVVVFDKLTQFTKLSNKTHTSNMRANTENKRSEEVDWLGVCMMSRK